MCRIKRRIVAGLLWRAREERLRWFTGYAPIYIPVSTAPTAVSVSQQVVSGASAIFPTSNIGYQNNLSATSTGPSSFNLRDLGSAAFIIQSSGNGDFQSGDFGQVLLAQTSDESGGGTIFRGGGPNPSNLQLRPGEEGLSFRNSLSNPYPPQGRPVFPPGGRYIEVDPSRLPAGSIIYDHNPPGHVTVIPPRQIDVLKNAIINAGKFPK